MANATQVTSLFEKLKSAMEGATRSVADFSRSLGDAKLHRSAEQTASALGDVLRAPVSAHGEFTSSQQKGESGSIDVGKVTKLLSKEGGGSQAQMGELFGGAGAEAGGEAAMGEAAAGGAAELGAEAAGGPIAIAAIEAKKKAEEWKKRLSSAGGHLMEGFQKESVTQATGQGLRAAGDVVGGMGPVGEQAEKVLKFGAAVVESVDKVRAFASSLHQANMQFAEFSGSMAGVQARGEVRQISREREQGERRAESAEKLSEAQDRLSSAMAPMEDAFANLKAAVMTPILDGLAKVAEGIDELVGLTGDADEGSENMNDWMRATQANQKDWLEQFQKPKRFGGE